MLDCDCMCAFMYVVHVCCTCVCTCVCTCMLYMYVVHVCVHVCCTCVCVCMCVCACVCCACVLCMCSCVCACVHVCCACVPVCCTCACMCACVHVCVIQSCCVHQCGPAARHLSLTGSLKVFNTYGLCQEHTLMSPGRQPFCHTSAAIIGQNPHIAASYSGGGYVVAWGSGTKTEWSSRLFPPAAERDGEVSGVGMRGRIDGGGSGQLSSIHPFLSLPLTCLALDPPNLCGYHPAGE